MAGQLAIELNAHHDNPIVTPARDRIISAGNYEALPRGTHIPNMNARDLEAHIGPPLEAKHMARLTSSLRNVERARKATEIIRRAIVALSEGRMLELARVRSLDELERGVVARAEPAVG